jgi:hypothetical protein
MTIRPEATAELAARAFMAQHGNSTRAVDRCRERRARGGRDASELRGVLRSHPKTPAATGPAETRPPPAGASATPDVVNRGWCGIVFPPGFQQGEARWWLGLTHLGDRIRVRFEVHRSAPGHRWNIRIFRRGPVGAAYLVFHGTSVASDAGDFVVHGPIGTTTGTATQSGRRSGRGSGMRGARLDRITATESLRVRSRRPVWASHPYRGREPEQSIPPPRHGSQRRTALLDGPDSLLAVRSRSRWQSRWRLLRARPRGGQRTTKANWPFGRERGWPG